MKKIHYQGQKLELYDSIEEIQADRFYTYNRFLLLDAGIGGDVEAVDNKIVRILQYIEKEDKAAAKLELSTLQQNLRFVITNTNPEMSAFVALIHRFNGQPVVDLSTENVRVIIKKLGQSRWSIGKIRTVFHEVKKNLIRSLSSFFQSSR